MSEKSKKTKLPFCPTFSAFFYFHCKIANWMLSTFVFPTRQKLKRGIRERLRTLKAVKVK